MASRLQMSTFSCCILRRQHQLLNSRTTTARTDSENRGILGHRSFHSSRIQMSFMSTPPPGKFEWLVVIPDKPGMQQKRLEVRLKHFEGLGRFIESGQYKTGGAIFSDKPDGDDPSKWDFAGSSLVMVAESRQEVLDTLSKDIYTTSGVWDLDKAQIWAAKFAFRNP